MSVTIAELRVRVLADMDEFRRDTQAAKAMAQQAARETAAAYSEADRLIAQGRREAAQQAMRAAQEQDAAEQKTANARKQLASSLSTGANAAGAGIFAGLALSTRAAVQFESAFAGVKKTMDGTPEQFAKLRTQLEEMSTRKPVKFEDLAKIAELGGQLGVRTSGISQFTEVVAEMAATTNLSAEGAATAMARIANVMHVPQGQFRNMGSTIVDLGNKFAASETEIVNFAQRLAGAASTIGMPTHEVLALSTAMASVGVKAEAGGTAMSTLMGKMASAASSGGVQLKQFAAVAGMGADEFQKLFKADSGRAIEAFVTGLDRLKSSGTNVFGVLKDMGLSGDRMRNMLQLLAGGHQQLTDALNASGPAWSRNNALADEFGKRAETTESQLQTFNNQVRLLGADLGKELIPALRDGVKWLSDLLHWFREQPDSTKAATVETLKFAGAFLLIAGNAGKALAMINLIKTAASGISGLMGMLGLGGAQVATTAATTTTTATTGVAAVGGGLLSRLLGPLAAGIAGQQAGGFVMDRALEANADTAQGRLRRAAGEHVRDQLMDITKGGMWGGIASLFKEMTGGLGSSLTPAQRAAALAGNRSAASAVDPLGDPADALMKKVAGGSAKESAFEMPSSAAAKQQEALLAAITKARNELNQAEKTGLGIASQVAAAFPQATAAKRAELVVLLQRREAIKDQQAEDARFRDMLAQAQGKTRDLTAALSGQKTGLEQLRAEHPKWSESMLRAVNNQNQWNASLKAAADQRAKAAADRQREVERFNQALENQKAQERDAVAALRGEGDSIERLRVAYPGVTDAKLRDLQASKAHTDAVIAQKKAAEDLAEAQKRAAEQAVEAKKKEQESFAEWLRQTQAATQDNLTGTGFGREIERFSGGMRAGDEAKARQAFTDRQESEQVRKMNEEVAKLQGTVANSASPFSLASVAVSVLGQSYESLGDKAKAALAPLARLMRQAAESDLLQKAAQATSQAQAQLQSTVSGNPLFALRAQNPGISDAALRQLAGQQAAANSANWQNQLIQNRTQMVRGQWDQLAQSQMGGMTQAEQRRLDYARSRLSGLPEPTTDAARQQRAQFVESLMGSDAKKFGFSAEGIAGGGGADSQMADFEKAKKTLFGSGEGQDAFFPAASKGMEFVSTAASSLADNLKAGEGGLGGALTVINQKIPETVGFLSMLAEAIAMIGTAAASAANQAAAGTPGASPAQAAQDAGRRQALAAARGG